jgi:hypothetical protein
MTIQRPVVGLTHRADGIAPLDLVVPFTSPRLTEVALKAAARLGAGLQSAVRLVRVQCVPFPLDLRQSPVPLEFLQAQLARLCQAFELPVAPEIRLAREFEAGLLGALRFQSMILLATKKQPWPTRTERLAARLRKAGYTVVMVREENEDA